MLHFQSGALIRRSADNTQISMDQSEEGESTTDFNQSQSLCILANFCQPKLTVGTVVKLQVFDSRILRIQVDVLFVIERFARIFDTHAKVRDVVISFIFIFTIFNSIGSFDWTS